MLRYAGNYRELTEPRRKGNCDRPRNFRVVAYQLFETTDRSACVLTTVVVDSNSFEELNTFLFVRT